MKKNSRQIKLEAVELAKLQAEIDRIQAEADKLRAEALKISRERAFHPVAVIGALSGIFAAIIQFFLR